jgi:hypothetical protein
MGVKKKVGLSKKFRFFLNCFGEVEKGGKGW